MFKPKSKVQNEVKASFVEGTPLIAKSTYCLIRLQNNALEILPLGAKGLPSGNTLSIGVNQIYSVAVTSERNIIETNKSPVGRAVAGGMLFGGTGAVVGGLTGLQKKQSTFMQYYLVISFKASSGADAQLVFCEAGRMLELQRFAETVHQNIGSTHVQL